MEANGCGCPDESDEGVRLPAPDGGGTYFTFSEVIQRLRAEMMGRFPGATKFARGGWNGKDMWICLSPGRTDCPAMFLWAYANRDYALKNGGTATVIPYITIKTADGVIVPWVASQADMLAPDWFVVETIYDLPSLENGRANQEG